MDDNIEDKKKEIKLKKPYYGVVTLWQYWHRIDLNYYWGYTVEWNLFGDKHLETIMSTH